MALPVGTNLQLRVYCTYRSQLSINTLYYLITTAPTSVSATVSTCAANFSAVLAPLYKAVMTNGATYYGCGVKSNPADGLNTWSNPGFSAEGQGVGTAGTDPMPTQCCGLIGWYTVFPGKPGRGRTYIPFPDNSDIVAGTGLFTGGQQAAYLLIANALGGAAPVTYPSTTLDAGLGFAAQLTVHKYNTVNFHDVNSAGIVRQGVATQRRRGTNFGRTNNPPF